MAIAAVMMSLIGVGFSGSASATPATLVVDDDLTCPNSTFSSIQGAVAAAQSGDTIQVCPGTYFEKVDNLGKNLTFEGPQSTVDPRSTSYPRSGGEAVVENLDSPVVTLTEQSAFSGFTVQGVFGTPNEGIHTGDGATVSNTVFTNVKTAISVHGLALHADHNLVDAEKTGFDLSHTGEGSVMTDNLFNGSLSDAAINFDEYGDPPLDGVQVLRNTMTSNAAGWFLYASGTQNLLVTDNNVAGSGQDSAGIILDGNNFDFNVERNVVHGFGPAGGIEVFADNGLPGNGNGTINRNIVQNNRIGLNFAQANSGPNDGTVEAHYNVLTGNNAPGTISDPVAGIRNTGGGTVNAGDNFFGCNTGPNSMGCDASVGDVTTPTYLVLSSAIGTKTLSSTQATTFTADLNHNSAGALVGTPVLDGLTITFAASNGLTVSPATRALVNGVATTTVKGKANGGAGWTGQRVSGRVVNAVTTQTGITVLPTTPALVLHDASTTEGRSGSHVMNFAVTLNHKYNKVVTVKYATANGSANAPSDYVAKSGTLTFPIGSTTQQIGVTVKGDTVKEANETFAVNIHAPVNATIADPNGLGVIRNS